MSFEKHTSDKLVQLFREKPFQGQKPENAKIIFLSSDANYSPEISKHPFFEYILEYQENGVEFWKKYGVHHPFLLSTYPFPKTSGGRPFHARFQKLGFDDSYAEHISFLELLDVPTIGNKSKNIGLFYDLISENHLSYIESLMINGNGKLFLVPGGVLRDIQKIKKKFQGFEWLHYNTVKKDKFSLEINDNRIQEIYHFSSSHIFRQIDLIRSMVDNWLKI